MHSLSPVKSTINKPMVPNNIAVYIGCLIYLYDPVIIRDASFAGMGDIRNLLFCMLMIAHVTNAMADKIKKPDEMENGNFVVVQSNRTININ